MEDGQTGGRGKKVAGKGYMPKKYSRMGVSIASVDSVDMDRRASRLK